jgi:regulator of protease activity HflC (stomatin/prohibitin superfamily)
VSSLSPTTSEAKPACQIEACALLIATAAFVVMGVFAAMPLAFSLASSCSCSGLTLLLMGTRERSRWNRFGAVIFAWILASSFALAAFLNVDVLRHSNFNLASGWIICAGAGALLFVAAKVSDSRTGEHGLAASLLRELWVLSLISAFAMVAGQGQPSVPAGIAAMVVRVWAGVVAIEGILRLVAGTIAGRSPSSSLRAPFLSRQLLYGTSSRREVVHEMDAAAVDDRSDSARDASSRKRSGRGAVVVGLVATAAIAWSLSGLVIVQTGHRAAHYRLGQLQSDMLMSGIHLTLPFPFARTAQFPVETVKAMTVGFVADPKTLSNQPMLWTKPHGDAEFPLVVGDGTELVAINAVVQYQVSDNANDLKAYVTFARDHDAMLRNLSQYVLMSETRTLTLQGLLSTDRAQWGRQIRSHLQDEIVRHQLGLEVIQFDVLSIHPPIEVADSFLDIVAARIDAEKEVMEAQAAYLTERRRCEMMAATGVADANAAASVRLTGVMDEALHLEALASVDELNSVVFRRRAFCDSIAEVLTGRSITLIDQSLPSDLKLWLGSQREIHPEAGR